MTWIKLDAGFPDHPKVALAGWKAAWLYVCGLTYCSRYLTDGLIPKAQVKRLTDMPRAVDEAQRLIDVGLWLEHDNHYEVHDYTTWQTPASKVEADKEAGKARAKASYDLRAKKRRTFAESSGEQSSPDVDVEVEASSSSGTDSPTGMLDGAEEEEEPELTEAQQAELDRRWKARNTSAAVAKYGPVSNSFAWRLVTFQDILANYAEGDNAITEDEPRRPYDREPCPENCVSGWIDVDAGIRCPACTQRRTA
jgi:hypothetical protein